MAGLRRGVIDQGKLEYNMTVDFEKLAGWQGLSLYTNGFLIHNTGRIRRDYVGGINTIAAIEAVPTGRLSELWLEQSFWNGSASLRVGQLAADVEFFYGDALFMFLQTDWPTITATNLPSGGPAYPLSTPGVRLKVEPNKNVSVLAAVFQRRSRRVLERQATSSSATNMASIFVSKTLLLPSSRRSSAPITERRTLALPPS